MLLTFAQGDLAVGEVDQVPGLLPSLGLEKVVEVEGHVFGARATRRVDLENFVFSAKWLRECQSKYTQYVL